MNRDDEKKVRDIAWKWWAALQPAGLGRRKGDAGALARLRRARISDAVLEQVTVNLYRNLKPYLGGPKFDAFETTALVATVLAHVREHDGGRPVARAAGTSGETKARLSPLRFRKLLNARDAEDCLIAFRRLVSLLNYRANVGDLALSLLEWNREGLGDRRRTRWAFDYYDAGSAAPSQEEVV